MTIKHEAILWHGDLNDDCTAKWNGLLLRAEWQNGEGTTAYWWWAVSSIETGEELDTSNIRNPKPNSGEKARKCAEAAAWPWLLIKGHNKRSDLELHSKHHPKIRPI